MSTNLRASQKYKKRSTFASIFRQLRKNKGAIIGLVMMIIIVALKVLAPVIFDYEKRRDRMNLRSACSLLRPSIGLEPMRWGGISSPRVIWALFSSWHSAVLIALVAGVPWSSRWLCRLREPDYAPY